MSPLCDVFLCFVTFPYGVSGQHWKLMVSISDLCLFLTFNKILNSLFFIYDLLYLHYIYDYGDGP